MTQKEQDFITFVKGRCKEHGVKCSLRKSKYVKIDSKTPCSGWFDEQVPELVVAMNRPDWIEILVHEYCHLTQWVEQIPLWVEAMTSAYLFWEWMAGKEVDNIDYHINVVRDLELDNEKRSVNLIKTFELNVDLENYIRKANSYVMFYNYIKQSRRWSKPGKSPYNNERLKSAMSSKFNMKYNSLPKRIEKIFIEEQF